MDTEDELKEELKAVSYGISDKRMFSTPEGYFDQLPETVLARWKNEEPKSIPHTITIRSKIATAAVITGVCFGVTWWTNLYTHQQHHSAISSEDAYQYIIEHLDDFEPLILESGPLAEELNTSMPPSTLLEEYLLEEMEDEDFENIF